MKFKLLAGTHTEGDKFFSAVGLNKNRGDGMPIVESDRDLVAIFKHKFEKIHDSETHTTDPDDTDDDLIDDDDAGDTDDDVDDTDDDEGQDAAARVITLKAVKRGTKMWDVVKVIDGNITDEAVNDDFLLKKDALKVVAKGFEE